MDWIGLDLTFPITDPTWIFLLVLLIILFAPILLNKLRIPHIIGMILAGLAVGYWKDKEEVVKNWEIDKTFTPDIPDEKREEMISGWDRAVKCSYGWAR